MSSISHQIQLPENFQVWVKKNINHFFTLAQGKGDFTAIMKIFKDLLGKSDDKKSQGGANGNKSGSQGQDKGGQPQLKAN